MISKFRRLEVGKEEVEGEGYRPKEDEAPDTFEKRVEGRLDKLEELVRQLMADIKRQTFYPQQERRDTGGVINVPYTQPNTYPITSTGTWVSDNTTVTYMGGNTTDTIYFTSTGTVWSGTDAATSLKLS